MAIPEAATRHYSRMQRLQSRAALQARQAWRAVDAGALSESWEAILRDSALAVDISAIQEDAATAGAAYGAWSLAAQGTYEPPSAFVNAAGFAGFAADGRSLSGLLYSPVPHTKRLIGGGMEPSQAKRRGGAFLEMVAKTTVADTGRASAGVDIATRTGVGYTRMLNPPSCDRCSILAGRFYRWNAGFLRHPGCDCVHVPSKGADAARSEGLIHDPYEYFQGLPEAEQDRIYGAANAQAIRDGGDIFQVVNSRRGMKPGGLMTTEGTSRRGAFGQSAEAVRTRGRRLTPEAIYQLNGSDRAAALRDLERYGYILPGGQNPTGSIRGLRTAANPATMTAAQSRLERAESQWQAALDGRNPFGSGPLTPTLKAQAENNYRRWIATNGEVFR